MDHWDHISKFALKNTVEVLRPANSHQAVCICELAEHTNLQLYKKNHWVSIAQVTDPLVLPVHHLSLFQQPNLLARKPVPRELFTILQTHLVRVLELCTDGHDLPQRGKLTTPYFHA